LTDFGLTSIVRGLNSILVTKVKGYTEAWAAPEVLEIGDKATQEADVFALGMVVIEVGPCVFPHLVLEVEGWLVYLTFDSWLGLYWKLPVQWLYGPYHHFEDHGWRTTGSSAWDTRIRSDGLSMGYDAQMLAARPRSSANGDRSGRTRTRMVSVLCLHKTNITTFSLQL